MGSTRTAKSTRSRSAIVLLAIATMASAQSYSPIGCYTSAGGLKSQGTSTYQSYSVCEGLCYKQGAAVMALQGSTCYCGSQPPSSSSKTSSSACSQGCPGYPDNICGGDSAFSVLSTGIDPNLGSSGGSSGGSSAGSGSSTSSVDSSTPATTSPTTSTSVPSTSPTSPTRTRQGGNGGKTTVTSVQGATTVLVTQQAASGAASSGAHSTSGGGTNVGAIAAGVVVGVLAVAAIVAGVFFYLRRRRQNAAEEEYKRTQVSDFMRGGERKAPGSAYSQMSDSRLDPEAGARRNSHGSIADNQDYSRRILRVANPDNS